MGFESIEPRRSRYGKRETPQEQVRAAVYVSAGKQVLAFNIGAAVLRKIGCRVGDRVQVLEGNASDRGRFLLSKAKPGTLGYLLVAPPNESKLPKGAPLKYGRFHVPMELLKYSRAEGPIALHPIPFTHEAATLTVTAGFLVPRKPGT